MNIGTIAYVAAVMVALLPLVSSGWFFYGSVNTKFFFVVLVLDIIALWVGYRLLRGRESIVWNRRWLLGALGLVLAAHYVSAYFGVFPEKSLWSDILRSTGVLYLTHIALFAVLLGGTVRAAGWALIRRTVVLSAAVFGLLSIVGGAGLGVSGQVGWLDFGNEGLTFGNSTFAGVYLLLAFMLGLIELVRSYDSKRWRKILYAALAVTALSPVMFNIGVFFGKTPIGEVVSNPVLLLGAARASSATMFLVLLFLFGRYAIRLFTPSHIQKYALPAWSSVLLVGTIAAVGLLFTPGSAVQEAYIDSSTEARIIVWQGGLEAVQDRPYFGWGPENYNDAHEKHFDNRLYLQENIGQVWFDRAHNVIVDTLVAIGYVGAAALLLFAVAFVWTVRRAYLRGLVSNTEAVLLGALLPAHFLQLQTGFDTVASYALWGVIIGYVLYLERQIVTAGVVPEPGRWTRLVQYGGGAMIIVLALVSMKFVLADEFVRQRALVETFQTPDSELQRERARISLAQVSDWESLRLSAASFVKGAIEGARHTSDPEAYVAGVLETAKLYEEKYETYHQAHPNYYRARMNHAYLLVVETGFGERRLEEARDMIDSSYELSPENPLTPALHAVVFLYGINFDKARELADVAIAMNPEIEFSHKIDAYIEEQIGRFPKNSILQLGNL